MKNHDFIEIGNAFELHGDFIRAVPYGSGHINDTFAVTYNQAGTIIRYLYQRINDKIFQNVPQLMENIVRVTRHQQERIRADGLDDVSRRSLTVILSRDGLPYYRDRQGHFWRAYYFIEKACTYDRIENVDQARQAASAFACFQKELVDITGSRLHETIPDFHNTRKRYQHLQKAIAADHFNRAKNATAEIAFFQERESACGIILDAMEQGLVPERVTHNDTKLNNVMIDDVTGKGICVIDLDTVMPGSVLYDFGDMIRTATNPALEDEKDIGKVGMQFEMFCAIAESYLAEASNFMTPTEHQLLPMSARIITMEIGIRFLTDYLQGDIYFKTHRDDHNLDRCRTQMEMVRSIESQLTDMENWLKERLPSCAF
jgi:hypothetical protein